MAVEAQPYSQDEKNITASAGSASEALTTREIECGSVLLIPKSTNAGVIYTVDPGDDTKINAIPATGLSLPIQNPALIKVAADTSGDDVSWWAV